MLLTHTRLADSLQAIHSAEALSQQQCYCYSLVLDQVTDKPGISVQPNWTARLLTSLAYLYNLIGWPGY